MKNKIQSAYRKRCLGETENAGGTRKLNLKMIINILRSKEVPWRTRKGLWKYKI